MLARLGFTGRLILIVLLLALAFITLGIGLSAVSREKKEFATSRMTVPQQAAAVVALLDMTSANVWPGIAKAVATPAMTLTIADALPPIPPNAEQMPAAEWLVSDFLDSKDRTVEVFTRHPPEHGRVRRVLDRLAPGSTLPVVIAIELADKHYAVFELHGPTTRRLFGIPYGFWVGVIGLLLSALAVFAIHREARPLRRLSHSVRRFARSGTPEVVPPTGAPEIRGLFTAFNAMQARIGALLEGRTMLLGAISHDLRTLLTRLRLRVELIPDAESRKKAARDIEDMTAMIEDGLAVARGTAASDRRETVNLVALVGETAATFDSGGLEWQAPSPVSVFMVNGDPIALRRVVTNLIDNALRYASRCSVSLMRLADHLELNIDDDGPGVPAEKRVVIFEPFYRLDTARALGGGSSGLGLAVVKTIVEAHQGEIRVEDSPSGGARFVVRLPAQPMPGIALITQIGPPLRREAPRAEVRERIGS